MLSLAFRMFGINENISFLMNNIIFSFSVLCVFFITFMLSNNITSSFFSALIFTLIPQNIIWSNTASVETSAAFFAGLTFLASLVYIKKSDFFSLLFYVSSAAFSIQFRPESLLVLIVTFFMILIKRPSELRNKKFYIAIVILILLSLNHWLHLLAVGGSKWGSASDKFGFEYFPYNLKTNFLFYFDNARFPVLYSLMFFAGLFLRNFIKEKSVLVLWFILFWGIFLFFYAGSYDFGVDVRYSLLSYIPLSILAGFGITNLKLLFPKIKLFHNKIIIIIMILQFITFLPLIRAETEEAWAARADHKYAKEFAELLPENSIVLTHNPNMFHLWGKAAAQSSFATTRKYYVDYAMFTEYTGGVFFHYNFWCNVKDTVQNSFCYNILEQYNHEIIKEFQEQDYIYVIYEISLK
jgi:hypothetical protein